MRTTRRTWLRGLTGATFAASTLRFLVRTAESATFPTRFLFVYTNAGRDSESRCTGMGPQYTLGPGLAALEPWKQKLLILDGLRIPSHTGEEHPCGKAALLTARPAAAKTWVGTGISFDRYLANKIANGVSFYTGTTQHDTNPGDIDLPISWNAANTLNESYAQGSTALMRRIFGAAAGAVPSAPVTPNMPSAATQNEAALYDHLMNEVKRLAQVAPRSQVQKLELHLQALQQLRGGLDPARPGGGPIDAPAPTRQCGNEVSTAEATTEADKLSLVAAHAFACGRARVGVLRIGDEDPYHNYSHWQDGASHREKMRQVDKERSVIFARLLKFLDSFPEGSGTLLDNMVVVWGSECCGEFGVGQSYGPRAAGEQDDGNGIHNTAAMPFVLAGKLGGKLKGGQRVVAPNRTNLDLFRTIAREMGVDASDFGPAGFSSGPLQEVLA